jgi:NADH:ubiquinone oxidoreductase subunit F (NADH-binding)/NADH:ubiquinone oxidoreductase subunit E
MKPASPLQSTLADCLSRVRAHEPEPFSQRELLVPFLQAVQRRLGYLPEEAIVAASVELGIPENEVHGTASFYPEFRQEPVGRFVIQICDSLPCEMGGCRLLLKDLSERLGIGAGQSTPDGLFALETVGCLGRCYACPSLSINGHVVTRLTTSAATQIIDRLRGGERLETLREPLAMEWASADLVAPVLGEPHALTGHPSTDERQRLASALSLSPAEVIEAVHASGLRGRGGAGFPTGAKWRAVAQAADEPKFLIANADESEIGTFKDRYLLTKRPMLVLGGMALAAYAIGAKRAYLFLRSAYGDLVEPLTQAAGALRESVPERSVEIVLRESPGGYLCGEETALIQALEGRRGESRFRPPYPTARGLFGKPTVVNNVETLANVPLIFADRGMAPEQESQGNGFGAKLFCLSGDVAQPGLIEAPFGTTLRQLLETAGGMTSEAAFGMAVLGGAGGRFLCPKDLDLPLTFEAGAGNGSIIVCHRERPPLQIIRSVLRFFSRESCGACLPCREGVEELCKALQPEHAGTYSPERLLELSRAIRLASRCGLGQTAPRLLEEALSILPDR